MLAQGQRLPAAAPKPTRARENSFAGTRYLLIWVCCYCLLVALSKQRMQNMPLQSAFALKAVYLRNRLLFCPLACSPVFKRHGKGNSKPSPYPAHQRATAAVMTNRRCAPQYICSPQIPPQQTALWCLSEKACRVNCSRAQLLAIYFNSAAWNPSLKNQNEEEIRLGQ